MRISSRLNATVSGNGARSVLLGHGFGTTQQIWNEQIAILVRGGFRVIAFDAAGATPATEGMFHFSRHETLFGFAEDLIELVRDLQLEGASYVGHSAAGMAGLLAAIGTPDLFDRLILISASGCYLDDLCTSYFGGFSPPQIEDLLGGMRSDYAAWANGFAPVVTAGNAVSLKFTTEFARSLLTLRPDIAYSTFGTILRSDHRADVRRNTLPVWMLQSASDAAVPLSAARWLAASVGAREFRLIETTGHFPHRSAPDQVGAALLEFLSYGTT